MKKTLVIVLALLMALAIVPTVAMAENTVVKANTPGAAYTITIPGEIDLGTLTNGDTTSKPFEVSASGVFLEDGGYIDVNAKGSGPDGTFRLYDLDGFGSNAVAFELKAPGGGVVAPNGRYARITGNGDYFGTVGVNKVAIPYAGKYSGIMTFTIGYQGPVTDSTEVADRGFRITGAGGTDIQFKTWKIKDLDSLEFTTYKDGVKVVSAKLNMEHYIKNAGHLEKTSVNTPFATGDDYWTITYGAVSADVNSVMAKVVKGGVTYIFMGPNNK